MYPLLCSSIKPYSVTNIFQYTWGKIAFMNIGGFSAFFNRVLQRTEVLQSVLEQPCIPRVKHSVELQQQACANSILMYIRTDWMFQENVQVVDLIQTQCGKLQDYLHFLESNASFLFWLSLFYKIMYHGDIPYAQM